MRIREIHEIFVELGMSTIPVESEEDVTHDTETPKTGTAPAPHYATRTSSAPVALLNSSADQASSSEVVSSSRTRELEFDS